MTKKVTKTAGSLKVREHRARLRALGLRPIQLWIPDTRTPEFKAEARRQSLAVAKSPQEEDDLAFVDSLSWFGSTGDVGDE